MEPKIITFIPSLNRFDLVVVVVVTIIISVVVVVVEFNAIFQHKMGYIWRPV